MSLHRFCSRFLYSSYIILIQYNCLNNFNQIQVLLVFFLHHLWLHLLFPPLCPSSFICGCLAVSLQLAGSMAISLTGTVRRSGHWTLEVAWTGEWVTWVSSCLWMLGLMKVLLYFSLALFYLLQTFISFFFSWRLLSIS